MANGTNFVPTNQRTNVPVGCMVAFDENKEHRIIGMNVELMKIGTWELEKIIMIMYVAVKLVS